VSGERFVVLGLASARSTWFDAVSQWTTSAAIAAEFIKCVSGEEVRARLASGRRHSALLVDRSSPALDRDLVDVCRTLGTAVIVVSDGRHPPVPADLGVAGSLATPFGPAELLDALAQHAAPVSPGTVLPPLLEDNGPASMWQAPLMTVTGPGGTGASTVAIALASGLGRDPRFARRVLLADLARRADQAMLHDSAELGPGIQELVEAHRLRRPGADEIAHLTFDVPGRGYSLLLGLRAPEAWASMRPRAVDAALTGLRRTFQVVVADLTGDFEGEAEGGSVDVEDRNHMARSAARQATINVVVATPGLKGISSLALLIRQMVKIGVDPQRIIAVVNCSPRHPRARAESSRALASLLQATGTNLALAGPVHLPQRRIDDVLRDGTAFPNALSDPITRAVQAVCDRLADSAPPETGPVRVEQGSLSAWAGDLEER
jgi:hypothetical protein